jgi:N-acetylglucosamine repressor
MAVKAERRKGRGPVGHAALRELNRALVLEVVRNQGPLSRSDLVTRTGLAKPTVTAIVQDLLGSSVIHEVGTRPAFGAGGRPATLLEFDPRHRVVIGCHIGNRRTSVMLADLNGDAIVTLHRPSNAKSARIVLDRLVELIEEVMKDADESMPPWAIGVALPGLIDSTSGVCIESTWFGWKDVPIRALLEERFGVPVAVRNDAKAAVIAEVAEGAARDEGDVVLLFEDQGIGSGIISGGTLLHGIKGVAGEIGHCRVAGATKRCKCGNIGCLETVASADALAEEARKAIGSANGRRLPRRARLADLAALGDARVDAVLEHGGWELGIAASLLINLFNPRSLVLGGDLPEAGPAFLGAFEDAVKGQTISSARQDVIVRQSAIPEGAEVRGAVLSALDLAISVRAEHELTPITALVSPSATSTARTRTSASRVGKGPDGGD